LLLRKHVSIIRWTSGMFSATVSRKDIRSLPRPVLCRHVAGMLVVKVW